jgi:predicted acyl esterase
MGRELQLTLSPTDLLKNGKYPGLQYEEQVFDKFVKYKDVSVPLRDGTTIYIDVYRPLDPAPAPALVAWSPYGKHGLKNLGMMPGADVDEGWVSKHAIWEGPDPEYWCPRGYVIISPDPRGAWSSEGTLTFFMSREGDDGYDLIEWIAKQPWSNGKVGMLGVSYLAISQWIIASKKPPSLVAICPWEGLSDIYREAYFHGGIPEKGFLNWWQPKSRFSLSPAEDMVKMCDDHIFIDEYWQSKEMELSSIEVPAFVVASWGDHGMHTRGTLEGFKQISSKEKWLEIHGQKKWRHFYHPKSVAKQTEFFDHFLKGVGPGVKDWPRVSVEVRDSNSESHIETYSSWPLETTRPTPYFLECASASMIQTLPSSESQIAYSASGEEDRVVFQLRFDQDIELTGGARLHLWLSSDQHTEADVFIALRKRDRAGREVGFRYYSTFSEGPLALGWLRASHRALAEQSTILQPIHDHTFTEPLTPGQAVPIDIEIWPFSVEFRAGETLELVVGANDLYRFNTGAPELKHLTDNQGQYSLYSGPEHDSYLMLPVIAKR